MTNHEDFKTPEDTFERSVTSGYKDYREASSFSNPIDTKHWFLNLLVLSIPFVNFILLFIWAFGDSVAHKKGYARAQLIITGVVIVLYTILLIMGYFSMSSYDESLYF